MFKYFKQKMNPSFYKGDGKRPHFEGWYFKVVDAEGKHLFAIIPGIFKGQNPDEDHVFIQVFDGIKNIASNIKYDVKQFRYDKSSFSIKIAESEFSDYKIKLSLESDDLSIHGSLNFSELITWPKSLISPGIMGWYSWVPFMECYHGIVSLTHHIEGALQINGVNVSFKNGKGYTEKDWGRSFPEAWVWLQSNHFKNKDLSITGSIAIIPWIRRPFPGFIVGLWYNGELYRFTTYLGSKIVEFKIDDTEILWILAQKNFRLEIRATRTAGGLLYAPTLNGMDREIVESLKSEINLRLLKFTKTGLKIIFEDYGKNAGLEVAGNMGRLVEMYSMIFKKQKL